MAYLDRPLGWGLRAPASLAVAAVHAAIGYALVAGMPGVAMESIRERALTGITFPVRPHGGDATSSTGVPEGVIVQRPSPPPPVPEAAAPFRYRGHGCVFGFIDHDDESIALGFGVDWPNSPGLPSRNPRPANDKATWFGPDNIPLDESDLVEDSMSYSLVVNMDGRVAACEIVRSSFSAKLDAAICHALTERARFEPGSGWDGTPVVGNYNGTVRWHFPE